MVNERMVLCVVMWSICSRVCSLGVFEHWYRRVVRRGRGIVGIDVQVEASTERSTILEAVGQIIHTYSRGFRSSCPLRRRLSRHPTTHRSATRTRTARQTVSNDGKSWCRLTHVEEGRSAVGEGLVIRKRLASLNGSTCKRESVLSRRELPSCPEPVDHLEGGELTAKIKEGNRGVRLTAWWRKNIGSFGVHLGPA